MKIKTIKKLDKEKEQQISLKIWACSVDIFNYSEYQMVNDKDREFFEKICVPEMIKGRALKDSWKPVVFMKKRQRKHTDFTVIGEAGLVMSKRALEALQPLMTDNVEVLPLKTLAREPFFFVNILENLAGLDEEKTIFQYSSVSKTKIGINKFVFTPEKVNDKHIFKLNGFWYNTFLSDEFRAICKKQQLQGLDFSQKKLLWKYKGIIKTIEPRPESDNWTDF